MARDEPESLWNFGEPEAWRRGRNIVVTIAAFYLAVQTLTLLAFLFAHSIEAALAFAVWLVIWWLALSFIWLGTHWIRWLVGAVSMLSGFALFIWGMRDGSIVQWSTGVIDLIIGAFFFAPSVHHFAVRQKENIHAPEKVIVAVVFLVLLGGVCSTVVGVNAYRMLIEREALDYGDEAMHRVFVKEDTAFLLQEASEIWRKDPAGNVAITRVLTQKDMRLGWVENTRVTGARLRSRFQFPATVSYSGEIDGEGMAKCGAVLLRLDVDRSRGRWHISGVWWRCLDTRVPVDPLR